MVTLARKASQPPNRPEQDRIAGLLCRSRVFGSLPPEHLSYLVHQSTLLSLAERERIFSQGDEGRTVMVTLEGYVKLSSSTWAGREIVLELAGPGSLFGELSPLDGCCRAADAHALTACRLLSIEARLFMRTIAPVPDAILGLVELLSFRLRNVTEQMADSLDLPGAQRLAKLLIKLARLHSHSIGDEVRIDLPLSQRELGAMTGLTRESINKHLSGWRDEGLIRISDRCITVLDRRGLERRVRDGTQEEQAVRARGEQASPELWTRASATIDSSRRAAAILERLP